MEKPLHWLCNGMVKSEKVFCDASQKAYGAVAYLKSTSEDGSFNVAIVASKTRVVLLARLSLPRLELMGGVVATRLATYVKAALNMEDVDTYFWTDSTVTLAWIKGAAHRWKTFVANRVQEI